jgi:hypothetical protein
MEKSKSNNSKQKYQKEYFRLTIIYTEGEFSGGVFKDREKDGPENNRPSQSLPSTKREQFRLLAN